MSILTIELEGRSRPLLVRYSAEPGCERVLVEQMEGFNDRDISEILRYLANSTDHTRDVARDVLELVGGHFVDMRAPGLPGTSRLYRDGHP